MYPNAAFRFAGDPLDFVASHGFAHVFAMTPAGPRVAHAPVLVADGEVCFHLANANAVARHLDGQRALLSIGGPGHYISPNWYGGDPSLPVPTWNYLAVEIEGPVAALDHAGLHALLDLSAKTFEPRVGENWTMAKLAPARRDAMMRAITGFVLHPDAIRSACKASQNRSDVEAARVAAALDRIGDRAGAEFVRSART